MLLSECCSSIRPSSHMSHQYQSPVQNSNHKVQHTASAQQCKNQRHSCSLYSMCLHTAIMAVVIYTKHSKAVLDPDGRKETAIIWSININTHQYATSWRDQNKTNISARQMVGWSLPLLLCLLYIWYCCKVTILNTKLNVKSAWTFPIKLIKLAITKFRNWW